MMIDVNSRMMHWILVSFVAVAVSLAGFLAQAVEPTKTQPFELNSDNWAKLKNLVLPQQSEIAFWKVAWESHIWTARQKSAATGKPIFVWDGSEGPPVTNC
jgi:hypothetical protein